jgi:hypothetical protein
MERLVVVAVVQAAVVAVAALLMVWLREALEVSLLLLMEQMAERLTLAVREELVLRPLGKRAATEEMVLYSRRMVRAVEEEGRTLARYPQWLDKADTAVHLVVAVAVVAVGA